MKINDVKLTKIDRPSSTEDCLGILMDKYGEVEGQKTFELFSEKKRQLYAVATRIQKEKAHMLITAGIDSHEGVRGYHYETLRVLSNNKPSEYSFI